MRQGLMHAPRYLPDLVEVAEHSPVAVDMRLKNFPIIDARLPRGSSVSKHEARLDLLCWHRDRLAMDAVRLEVDRIHAPVERRVVVLAARRDLDELRFHGLRDHADLFALELAPRPAGERRRGRDHQRRRAGNARARW